MAKHDLSVQRACAAVRFSRAAYYRQPGGRGDRDDPIIAALNEIVAASPRWGFWKCNDRLRLHGRPWNHKRVLRVYREMRLNLPRSKKKRVPHRERQTLLVPAAANAIWALDFMSDALYHGRRFRTFNVLNEGVREGLDIVIDTSIPAGRVVRTLEQISRWRGLPDAIRCDNGPKFLSRCLSTGARRMTSRSSTSSPASRINIMGMLKSKTNWRILILWIQPTTGNPIQTHHANFQHLLFLSGSGTVRLS